MKVILLMAGGSEAFQSAGYLYPKSLVEVDGAPIVQHVVEHLGPLLARGWQLVALVQREEVTRFHLDSVIRLLVSDAIVVRINGSTGGAACSALLAVEHIVDDEPVLIINGDQLLECDICAILDEFVSRDLDGGTVVFRDVHPRWSFVKCDNEGFIIEAAEKRPISNLATAGIYYFRRGEDFVEATTSMIRKDAQVNGLFFVCPIFNEMVLRQLRLGVVEVPKQAYHSLANPQDVVEFERSKKGRRSLVPPATF